MQLERGCRLALTAALLAACDRGGHRETPATPLPTPAKPAPVQGGCTLAPIPLVVPVTTKRVVAIGDLHGDLGGTRAALRAAKAIDDKDRWIGGDVAIVQTGDILDRGDDEVEIYQLLERLDADARKAGGAIILLNGNHELMNAARDYRYVTPGAMADFGPDRQHALDPGGPWAKRFARSNIVAIVDGTVYSHAGVLPEWLTQLDDMNLAARCWLDGQAGGPGEPPLALSSESSPVWTRTYGMPDVDCAAVEQTLAKLGAKRMVVGHTVQPTGINAACDGKLWRIDVGLAKLYNGPIQVLEVAPAPTVLTGSR
jgi:hypothetical protein